MGNKQSKYRYDNPESDGELVYPPEQSSKKTKFLPRIHFQPFKLDFGTLIFTPFARLRGQDHSVPLESASVLVGSSRRSRRSILRWPEAESEVDGAHLRGLISSLTLADLVNNNEENAHATQYEKTLPATPNVNVEYTEKELPSLPIPSWHRKCFSEGDAAATNTVAVNVGAPSASMPALPLLPCPLHGASSCLRYDCLDCNPEQRPMMFKF